MIILSKHTYQRKKEINWREITERESVLRSYARHHRGPSCHLFCSLLYTFYTTLQKFADDSAVVGCIKGGQESEYRDVVASYAYS